MHSIVEGMSMQTPVINESDAVLRFVICNRSFPWDSDSRKSYMNSRESTKETRHGETEHSKHMGQNQL